MRIFHRSSFHRSNRVFSLILMFSILMTQMLYGGQIRAVQAADASSIVINEFRTRGGGGTTDEFIELYNRSDNAIDILGWEIKFYNSFNNKATLIHFSEHIILPAGGYYLLANENYNSLPIGDGKYLGDIPDDSGLALIDNSGVVIDAVGMKTGLVYLEGNPLTPMTVFSDQSYQRKYDALNRQVSDTNNNADDFIYNSGSSDPQSSKFVNVVISQVYGGGGNSGATYKNDFIELYNHGARPIDLTGWSVQYASYNSAKGTNWQVTALSGTILPGQYYLIQEAAGSNGTTSLAPDVVGTINMSATAGKVALVNNTTALSDACPLSLVVDMVGFGTGGSPVTPVNCSEGLRAPAPSNTTAIFRGSNGAQDTNENSADFVTGAPTPRGLPPMVLSTTPAKDAANAAKNGSIAVKFSKPVTVTDPDPWYSISCVTSGTHSAGTSTTDNQTYLLTPDAPFTRGETCSATVLKDKVTLFKAPEVPLLSDYTWSFTASDKPVVSSTIPTDGTFSVALDTTVTIKFDEPVNVAEGWFSLTCSKSGDHSAEVATSDQLTYTLTPSTALASGESCAAIVAAAHVTSLDTQPVNMLADYKFGFITVAKVIRDIQGAGHFSMYDGQSVTDIPGVVTALRSNGFYMQDPSPDAYVATSEGIFVLTNSKQLVGDAVKVSGKVSEYRPAATSSLTITEITGPTVTTVSSGNALPDPVVLGTGGRIPPSTAIEDDAVGSAEAGNTFDPANDGIDFYESLEGMRVQLNDAQAVGPTKDFTSNREIPVVGDNGANATTLTPRGGVIVTPSDFNPERIILNDMITGGPVLSTAVSVGDKFPGVTLGIMDYSYGNYKLEVTQLPTLVPGNLPLDTAPEPVNHQLSIATFNLENLAPGDPDSKYSTLANLIVTNMKSPDILAVEEIQDNTGATNDGVVDASTTYAKLITAITTAGGPTYDYRQIDPQNDQDGGATGGNIRVGFLFRTDRGVSFVDRTGADATTPNQISGTNGPELLYSPGRIDPTNAAFNDSRKPLAGEFTFNGETLFVIANHFNSKGGDDYLFGVNQPPTFSSEVQRKQQATIVHDFVNQIVTADPNANVVVLGDLNDFQFSDALGILKGTPVILNDLIETLPANQQYTYVYEGNSEALDHILTSNALFGRMVEYKPVHVNAEYSNQASDHDPQVLIVDMNHAPKVDKGISGQSVQEDQTLSFTFASDAFSDADQDALTYSAALGDGSVWPTWLSFDAGSRTFSGTPNKSNVGTLVIRVKASDPSGAWVTSDFNLEVINVNEPPSHTGSLTPQVATQDQSFSFTIPSNFFTDADMDQLTYSASLVDGNSLPAWLSLGEGPTFSGTPGNGDVGVIQVRITASDPSKASDYADFDITVENINDSPSVASPISDAKTLVKQAYSFQFDAGAFIDIDKNDTLTYTASLADGSELPTWLQFDPLTRTFSGTPDLKDEGMLSIKVTATDGSGDSISTIFNLTVWSYKTYMPVIGN